MSASSFRGDHLVIGRPLSNLERAGSAPLDRDFAVFDVEPTGDILRYHSRIRIAVKRTKQDASRGGVDHNVFARSILSSDEHQTKFWSGHTPSEALLSPSPVVMALPLSCRVRIRRPARLL
jgi:hypothetical protein